jgi:hypothetical protein
LLVDLPCGWLAGWPGGCEQDANGDGLIDESEMNTATAHYFGREMSGEEARAIHRVLELEGLSSISIDLFCLVLAHHVTREHARLEAAGPNASEAELAAGAASIVSAFEEVIHEQTKKNSLAELYRLRQENTALERQNTQLTTSNQRLQANLEKVTSLSGRRLFFPQHCRVLTILLSLLSCLCAAGDERDEEDRVRERHIGRRQVGRRRGH